MKRYSNWPPGVEYNKGVMACQAKFSDLPVKGPWVTVTSVTGEKRAFPTTGGKLTLEVTGSPQYLVL